MPERLRAAPVKLGCNLKVPGNPKKQKLQRVEERYCNLQLRGRPVHSELKEDMISKGILAPLSSAVLTQAWSTSWVNLHPGPCTPWTHACQPSLQGVRNSSLPKLCLTPPPVPPHPSNHQSSGWATSPALLAKEPCRSAGTGLHCHLQTLAQDYTRNLCECTVEKKPSES